MDKAFLRSILFGVVLSAGSLAILAHGFFAAGSAFTGAILTAPVGGLILLGSWRSFRPNAYDAIFVVFTVCIATSIALRGTASDWKEVALLLSSLAAYPAGRLLGDTDPVKGVFAVAAPTVVIGALVTIPALIEQWSARHGKPMVFGEFDAAPAQFTMLLSFVILAAVTSGRFAGRRMLALGLALALPVAAFAASQVRFTFLALAVALATVALLDASVVSRKVARAVLGIAICAIVAGGLARWRTTSLYLTKIATASDVDGLEIERLSPSTGGCPPIQIDNSIAIRKQLYVDVFRILPQAGLFGIGLDRFAERSCVRGFAPHNTFMQAAVEFGWIAGAALLVLLFAPLDLSMVKLARISAEARFTLAGVVFAALMASAHGRISRDDVMFLMLGYIAALRSRSTVRRDYIANAAMAQCTAVDQSRTRGERA